MVLVQKCPFFQIFVFKFLFLKTRSSKSRKIALFPKGLTHGFGPKMPIFSNFCFQIFVFKNKKFKKSKNCPFSKGVNPWFWSKNAHFFKFLFLGNIGQENVFYDILEHKNAFLGYKNKHFKQSKNKYFLKKVNPWFWSKNSHFSNFSFLGIIGQENVFHDILERKNAFLGYKTKKIKKSVNWNFTKPVNPWFWSKNGNFSNFFFLRNMGQENIFYDILERKHTFLSYKNKKFKTSKNWHFSTRVNPWIWSKNGHFSNFIFKQYRPRKCLFQYSRAKKRLSRL